MMFRHSLNAVETTRAASLSPPTLAHEVENAPFTAQEITDAIAAVEKERDEQVARASETGQIAHVLEQMGLDLSAEAVVERARKNRFELAKYARIRRVNRWAVVGNCIGLMGGFLVVGGGLVFGFGLVSSEEADRQSIARVATIAPVDPGTLLVTDRNGAIPVVKTFAEVADGVPVAITADKLPQLLRDSLPDGLRNQISASFDPVCEWTVSRKNGEYYLRGYVEAHMTPAATLAAPAIRLYNSRDVHSFGRTHPTVGSLTVPIRAIRVRQSQSLNTFDPFHILDVTITDVDKAVFGK